MFGRFSRQLAVSSVGFDDTGNILCGEPFRKPMSACAQQKNLAFTLTPNESFNLSMTVSRHLEQIFLENGLLLLPEHTVPESAKDFLNPCILLFLRRTLKLNCFCDICERLNLCDTHHT